MAENSLRKWWVLIGCGIAAVIVPIDFTIVNTCLSPIQQTLGMPMNQLQWLMTGFGITFCSLLAVAGRVADVFGRRKVFYLGVIGFAIASFAAGFADTATTLIIARFFQGLFGALIFPSGFAIVADTFPQEEHGRALGIFGACMGIGLAMGPVLGGIIASTIGWRWIFFINIPVVALSAIICIPTVHESCIEEKIGIDYFGALLLIISLSGLVFGISQSDFYGWVSWPILTTLIVSVAAFILLLIVETKTKDALLPLKLFKNDGFLLSAFTYSIIVGFAWVIMFLTPLYLHDALGLDTLKTGLMLLPMTSMTFITPYIAGIMFDKLGAKVVVFFAFAFSIISYLMQLFFNVDTSLLYIIVTLFFFGTGWGIMNGVGIPFAISHLKNTQDTGIVSGAIITLLNLTGVVTLAVITTVFHYASKNHLENTLKHGKELPHTALQALKEIIADPDKASTVVSNFSHTAGQTIMQLFHNAFMHGFMVSILILMLITIIFYPIVMLLSSRVDKYLKSKKIGV